MVLSMLNKIALIAVVVLPTLFKAYATLVRDKPGLWITKHTRL